MTRPSYESADALIYDPVASNRNSTLAALQALGFRTVAVAPSMETLRSLHEAGTPDLMLCEVSASEAETCAFLQSIRQGQAGKNPFMVIMATTWRSEGGVVGQVLNSGADDLIGRPFSTPLLAERIKTQIERRKAFVVTADYIGPDRRRDPKRSGPECMAVANSLRIKTSLGLPDSSAARRVADEIRDSNSAINLEKMRRNAFQLCVQWRLLEQRRPGGHDFAEVLARMKALSDDIARRAVGTPRIVAVQWCDSVAEALTSIQAMIESAKLQGDDSIVDLGPPMHLLGQAALTLGKIFAPGDLQASHLVELDALMARLGPVRPMRGPDPDMAALRAAG